MKKLDILYEDKELLIVNKPAKLLTIATEKRESNTLYSMASFYVKKQYPKNKVFIVNRLDKDTSGIVVFAKNEKLKHYLQENWQECALQRLYMGVVEGRVKGSSTLQYYLAENNRLNVYITDKEHGKLCTTKFKTIKSSRAYSLLDIEILSGRKHQIRVSLSEYGYPLIGDKKYGSHKNPIGRLGLHCYKLTLHVPYRKDDIVVETKIPKEFLKIFEGGE